MGIENGLTYGVFGLLGTLAVYNVQRLFKVRQSVHLTPWLGWVKSHYILVALISVLSAVGAMVALFVLRPFSVWSGIVLLSACLMGMFYVVRIGKWNLRSIPFLKIHVIALSWTLLLIVFPLVNQDQISFTEFVAAHYLYVLAVTIPFDIRDLRYDETHYKTIPQVFGVTGATVIANGALLGYILLVSAFFPELHFSPWFWCVMGITFLLITGARRALSDWYCAGMIDGSIALLGLVYLLA